MSEIWITNETPARALTVRGRSAIDIDCLVADLERHEKAVWILDGNGSTENCAVLGAGSDIRARKIVPVIAEQEMK